MDVTLRVDGTAGGLAIGPTYAILDAIAGNTSLLAAARTLGISYRSAWSRLAAIEATLGQSVVIKTKGHGTALTPYGAALLASLADTFQRLGPVLAAEEIRLADALRRGLMPEPRRLRLAASHDPLLLGAVAEIPGLELSVAGSLDALAQLRAGTADAAGFHYGARTAPPTPFDALFTDPDLVVQPLFDREQGFMLAPGHSHAVSSLRDIARLRLRFVNRQRGAGTRIWFERLCAEADLSPEEIVGARTEEFTHSAVAALIATGAADVGMGTPAVAERFGLAFHSVGWETYFLATRADFMTDPLFRVGYDIRTARGQHGSPLLEGEGQGEVCDFFGDGPHLTPTLSFQERGPVATRPRRSNQPPGVDAIDLRSPYPKEKGDLADRELERRMPGALAQLLADVAKAAEHTLGYAPPSPAYQSAACG